MHKLSTIAQPTDKISDPTPPAALARLRSAQFEMKRALREKKGAQFKTK